MSEMICDFCSANTGRYTTYNCQDFACAVVTDEKVIPAFGSEGGFLACDECNKLIVARQWDQLINRALNAFTAGNPGLAWKEGEREFMEKALAGLYAPLRAAIEGRKFDVAIQRIEHSSGKP